MSEEKPSPLSIKEEIFINPGESLSICRCGQSNKFPFCDGSHREHQEKTGICICSIRITCKDSKD